MRKLILCICLFICVYASAQQARVKTYSAPLAGTSVLRDVKDKYGLQVYNLESPGPDGNAEKVKLREIKEEIARKYPYRTLPKTHAKSTAAPSPVVLAGYVADSFPGMPPDNYMAISNGNKAVSVINSSIAVSNPQTGQVSTRKTLDDFAAAVGLPYGTFTPYNYKYDPKVIYDPNEDRFIAVILNGVNQNNWIVLGFSQTNDPEGAWNFYKLYGDYASDTTWFDYPTIAITDNEFFLSGNKILYNGSWQAGFRQSVIYQVRKADGYNGAANITYNLWDSIGINNNIYIRNLFPVKGGGGVYGPEQYFLSNRNFAVQNDTILLIKIPDTIGSTNNNLNVTVLQSNIAYGVPPDGRQDSSNIPSIGRLATNDGRVLGAFIENDEIQFVSASLNTGTGSSSVYHGKISNVSVSPTIAANMFVIDSLDFGYPNISFTGNQGGNTSIISFNYTGPKTHAGIGAIYYDGSQFSDLVKVRAGDSLLHVVFTGLQRWGDYTGSQPYWPQIGKVWVEGIYGRKDKKYGNWIAEIGAPSFAASNGHRVTEPQLKVYPNPAIQVIQLEFNVDDECVVNFDVYDMQGKLVDNVNQVHCKKGRNLMQVNVGSLPAGNYIMKGSNDKGRAIMAEKFVRQ
jgi:hypothetical protein